VALLLSCLTLFMGGGILALAAATMRRYYLRWRRTPGAPGLLYLHVLLVAGSYLLLITLMMAGAISGGLQLADWRAAIRIPALALGLAAMFVLVNFQRKTYGKGEADDRTDDDDRGADR